MIKNPKNYPLVEIEWIDSTAPQKGGWIIVSKEDFEKDYITNCYTCGYVIGETEQEFKIVGSYHERTEDDINSQGFIAIPKVAIIQMREIKKESRKK